jgi:hypothetical protein
MVCPTERSLNVPGYTLRVVTSDVALFEWIEAHSRPLQCVMVTPAELVGDDARSVAAPVILDEVVCTPEFAAALQAIPEERRPEVVILLRPRAVRDPGTLSRVSRYRVRADAWRTAGITSANSATVRAFRRIILGAVSARIGTPTELIALIEAVVSAEPPVRSVSELARRLGATRGHLLRLWRDCYPGGGCLSLTEFVDVWLVMEVIERRSHAVGLRWFVTRQLHCRARRLRAASRSVAEMEYEDLVGGRLREALERIASQLIVPLSSDQTQSRKRSEVHRQAGRQAGRQGSAGDE